MVAMQLLAVTMHASQKDYPITTLLGSDRAKLALAILSSYIIYLSLLCSVAYPINGYYFPVQRVVHPTAVSLLHNVVYPIYYFVITILSVVSCLAKQTLMTRMQ